jgi:hypothetical protein
MRDVSIVNGTGILTQRGVVPVEHLSKSDKFVTGLGAVLSPFIVESGDESSVYQVKLTAHADPFLLPAVLNVGYMTGEGTVRFSGIEKTRERALFRPSKNWGVYLGADDDEDAINWDIADPFYLNAFTDRAVLASAFRFVELKDGSSQIWLDAGDPVKNRALGLCLSPYGLKVTRQPDTSILLEGGRPACWPSKLLMGSFLGPHASEIIADFYSQGIFATNQLVSRRLVDLAVMKRRPMEGYTLDNLSFVEYIKPTKLTRGTTIVTVPENVLIPTPWVQL